MGTRHDSKQTTRFGDKPKNTGYGKYTKEHPSVVPIKKASASGPDNNPTQQVKINPKTGEVTI